MFLTRSLPKPSRAVGADQPEKMNEAGSAVHNKRKKKTVSKKLHQWLLSVGSGKKGHSSSSSSNAVNQQKKDIGRVAHNNKSNENIARSPIIVADATVETCHFTRPVDESENDYIDYAEVLVLSPSDAFSTCDSQRGAAALTLPQVQVAEDDVSSVSILSSDPRRHFVAEQQQQQHAEQEIPVVVYVPEHSCSSQLCVEWTEASSSSCANHSEQQQHRPEDPAPQQSVMRTDRPLDLSSVENMVSKPLSELDPELRARLQAIHQLSSMTGASHPDVRFSMKYTSRLLYKRGDFMGAQVLQNYIQDVHREIDP